MADPVNLDRTWLCSVLFVDIIQYSRQSLEVQSQWKHRFNLLLAEALKEAPAADRVILDTGDGAAICFLGDPETAMFCALHLVSAIEEEKARQAHPFRVRAGINLGSVKLVKDINGNLNAVGDGINVGQRVMSFAGENQILVSRSFYEVASSISESYAGLFKYEGVHKDKHVREHTLYELHPPAARPALGGNLAPDRHAAALTAEQTAIVEHQLAALIGPMAPHLLRNACQRAENPAELCQALLSHIPSPPEREKFLKACREVFPTSAVPSDSSAPEPPRMSLPSHVSSHVWDPAVLAQARHVLAAYVGPMARLLVDRAAAQTQSPAALYELLAAEITSPKDRAEFLERTR